MNKLEELLEKLCPNGVEYKPLSKLVIKNPKSKIGAKIAEKMNKGEIPFFTSGKSIYYIKDYLVEGENIFVNDGGQADIKYYKGKACYADHVISFKTMKIKARFLFHYLMKERDFINEKMFRGSGIKNINKNDFFSMLIPVPPIEVQDKIVSILDNFTLLLEDLSKEQKERKKQYEYYENLLFDFEKNNKPYKKVIFNDIATFSQGLQVDINKQYYEPFENSVPFLRIVDFVNHNEPPRYIKKPKDKYLKKENEMIMIRYGASAAGRVFINKSGAIANNMFKIKLKENSQVDIKYLKYYLSQKSIYNRLNGSGKSTMPAINFGFLGKLVINIPEKEEQLRIVKILDNFEILTNNPQKGIPAEIAAREKQYEYYRDKLLSFKKQKIEN